MSRFDRFLRHDRILTCGLNTLPTGWIAVFVWAAGNPRWPLCLPNKQLGGNLSQAKGVRITKYL
jgi:hypothetical protein